MKHISIGLLLFIIAGSISACQKIPGHFVTPGASVTVSTGTTGTSGGGITAGTVYNSSSMASTSAVRLFAASGEITDTAVIGRFLRNNGITNLYMKGYSGPFNAGSPFSIQLGNGTASIIQGGGYISTKTTTTGYDVRMTTKDSIIDIMSDPDKVYLYSVTRDLSKYSPTYDILIPPGQSGNPFSGYLHNYLSDYYVTINGAQLNYPLVFGTVVRHSTTSTAISTLSLGFNFNNKFGGIGNRNLLATSIATDTVVFQEFNVVLTK